MSNLLYLVAAVIISALGGLVLWARHRRPQSLEAGIDEFRSELRALAPDRGDEREARSG